MASPIGSKPSVSAAGTGQHPWRRLNSSANTFTGTMNAFSNRAHTVTLPATSADFSTASQIVTPQLEPGVLSQWKFYLHGDAGKTASARCWGISEICAQVLDSSPPQGETVEYMQEPLLEVELTAGIGAYAFTSRALRNSTEAGLLGEAYFASIVIASDYTRNPGARIWAEEPDSGWTLEFDLAGFPYLLWEFKLEDIGAGLAAAGVNALFRVI